MSVTYKYLHLRVFQSHRRKSHDVAHLTSLISATLIEDRKFITVKLFIMKISPRLPPWNRCDDGFGSELGWSHIPSGVKELVLASEDDELLDVTKYSPNFILAAPIYFKLMIL